MKTTLDSSFTWRADAVAIGASAGGIDALLALLQPLPADFAVPVLIVLHMKEGHESRLPELFSARTKMSVTEASAHAPVTPGTIHFAPPGYHLLVEPDRTFSLSCDPPVLFSRPSIDVFLESCADAYGERLLALVLTGASEDGARGLARVREAGGLAAVQDPEEAAHAVMPSAAIARAHPQFVLPLDGLRELLLQIRTHHD